MARYYWFWGSGGEGGVVGFYKVLLPPTFISLTRTLGPLYFTLGVSLTFLDKRNSIKSIKLRLSEPLEIMVGFLNSSPTRSPLIAPFLGVSPAPAPHSLGGRGGPGRRGVGWAAARESSSCPPRSARPSPAALLSDC